MMFRISFLSLTVFVALTACQGRPELPSIVSGAKYTGEAGQGNIDPATGDAAGTPQGAAPGATPQPETPATPEISPATLALNKAVDEKVPASFEGDLKALIDANCVSCHTPGKISGGVDLSTLDGVKNNIALVISEIRAGEMPPGNAAARPAAKRESIELTATIAENWSKAPSNFAATMKDIQDINYVSAIEPLNAQLCGTCHSEVNKKANVILADQDQLKASIDTMITVTGNGAMPPEMDAARQTRIKLLLQEWKLRNTP